MNTSEPRCVSFLGGEAAWLSQRWLPGQIKAASAYRFRRYMHNMEQRLVWLERSDTYRMHRPALYRFTRAVISIMSYNSQSHLLQQRLRAAYTRLNEALTDARRQQNVVRYLRLR